MIPAMVLSPCYWLSAVAFPKNEGVCKLRVSAEAFQFDVTWEIG